MLDARKRSIACAAALLIWGTAVHGQSEPESDKTYPDWSGQWSRVGSLDWPPEGYGEAGPPPLTQEYEAIWEGYRSMRIAGIPADDPTTRCLPPGMPRMMKMPLPMEIIVTPDITYIFGTWDSQFRRVYTDGRPWPEPLLPTFNGYSIGEWRDENGDQTYDTLSIETRGMKGPRAMDHHGVPLHANGETVVYEEIRLVDRTTIENTITTVDDAFTGPWTTNQRYTRKVEDIKWDEHLCIEGTRYVELGEAWYIFDPEEESLEPANRNQPSLVPYAQEAQ